MRSVLVLLALLGASALAQGPPPDGMHGPPPGGDWGHRDQQGPPHGHPFGAPPGKWWRDPGISRDLTLTPDQQRRMDDIYTQSRVRLIDLTGALRKEEAILEPMLGAEHVDESRTLMQIDRVAQARAELEKASARMLLGFRGVLSQDQWKRLQAGPPHPPGGPGGQVR